MQVVLEGIRGEIPVAELCTKYEINQAQYYKWRDLLLNGAERVFIPDLDKEKDRMRKKIDRLTQHIGELTIELKKTEELL